MNPEIIGDISLLDAQAIWAISRRLNRVEAMAIPEGNKAWQGDAGTPTNCIGRIGQIVTQYSHRPNVLAHFAPRMIRDFNLFGGLAINVEGILVKSQYDPGGCFYDKAVANLVKVLDAVPSTQADVAREVMAFYAGYASSCAPFTSVNTLLEAAENQPSLQAELVVRAFASLYHPSSFGMRWLEAEPRCRQTKINDLAVSVRKLMKRHQPSTAEYAFADGPSGGIEVVFRSTGTTISREHLHADINPLSLIIDIPCKQPNLPLFLDALQDAVRTQLHVPRMAA